MYKEQLDKDIKAMEEGKQISLLAKLRAYGNVLETKMSESAWSEINYEIVPAKANMKYDKAFERHDLERRSEYLEKVFLGEGKSSSSSIFILSSSSSKGTIAASTRSLILLFVPAPPLSSTTANLRSKSVRNGFDVLNPIIMTLGDGVSGSFCRKSCILLRQ